MSSMSIRRNGMPAAVAITLTVLIGCVNLIDVRLSLVLVVGLIVGFVLYQRPPYALAALIFLAPFSGTTLLSGNFAGVPGLKIINLVLLAVVAVFLLSKRSFRISGVEFLFIFGSVLLMTVGILRSLPHLYILNQYFELSMGVGKYIVSYLVKPAFSLFPFLIIAGYMRERSDIDCVIKYFKYAILMLSSCVLVFYLVGIGDTSNWSYIRYKFGDFFGIHTNGLSDFYILGYPILLAWFLFKKSTLDAVNLLLALASIAVLFSRTAYVLTIVSTILFLVLEKRKRFLPLIVALGISMVFIAPDTVIERGLTGFEEGEVRTISAGRVGGIWLPLLEDVKDEPIRLFIGSGRYATIHSSPVWKGHAHNMYLNTFLDTGILGLSFFLIFFFSFLRKIQVGMNELPPGKYRIFLAGTLVSIVAYLISGLTGRDFFPEMSNTYLWISLAIALNIIKLDQREKTTYEI